jgi:Na+-translocating ferredoxin:NAD+ oxidoreductase RnfD subunit
MIGCTCYNGGGWLGDWLVGGVFLVLYRLVRWMIGSMVGHVQCVHAAGWLVG